MKKIQNYLAGAAVLALTAGCSHEMLLNEGEGKLVLKPSVNSDMTVVSRSDDAEALTENVIVWISNEKGIVRQYANLQELLEANPINLVTGSYTATAWAGDSVPASWEERCFKGVESFLIEANQTSEVNLVCRIANVGVSVRYSDDIDVALRDYTFTVGHKVASLEFVGREERRGYFMMPSFDRNLTYELKGIQIDGSEFVYDGVIENAQPGKEYVFNITYTPASNEVGGSMFTIEIDESDMDEQSQNIELVPAPKITGYGFDINSPVMGEAGTIGRRSVYVTSATKVDRIELKCAEFAKIAELGGFDDFELIGMETELLEAVKAFGITHKYNYDPAKDETIAQINFEEEFIDNLPNGDYTVTITATDALGKTTTSTLTLLISDAPVATAPVEQGAVSYFSVTLRGTASKADTESVGFEYRPASNSRAEGDWTYVAAAFTNGLEFTAVIDDLKDNATYEYRAVTEGFASQIIETFTTKSAQLPNSSFEDWWQNGNPWIPMKQGDTQFWDSGNTGATIISANSNITTRNSTYKHSGAYSACLKSTLIFGTMAAGNLFAGKYIKNDGTNGVLGWGRPFEVGRIPKAVRVWVKYEPVNVTSSKTDMKPKDELDEGIIYIAILDDNNGNDKEYGTQWPIVIRTKSPANLFSQNDANVLAYGERVFKEKTEAADGGLMEITFDVEQKKAGTPANIIFVASSSRYGDYFTGGNGSTMYIDDIELIY